MVHSDGNTVFELKPQEKETCQVCNRSWAQDVIQVVFSTTEKEAFYCGRGCPVCMNGDTGRGTEEASSAIQT